LSGVLRSFEVGIGNPQPVHDATPRQDEPCPHPRFTPEELQQLHDLARQWAKIVSRRAFGDDGPGLDVDFNTFEQIATAAAHGLTKGTSNCSSNNRPASSPPSSPVRTAGNSAPRSPAPDRSPPREPRSNKSSASPTVPTAGGTFSPCGRPWDWMSTPSVPPSSNASSRQRPGSPRLPTPPTPSG
jgi:hypothetical protein